MSVETVANYESDPAVNNLRNYLRIRSVHPNVNYDECLKFLKDQAKELDLPVKVFEPLPKKPVLVMTWEGLEPTLPSILLNSHMDVVPVFEGKEVDLSVEVLEPLPKKPVLVMTWEGLERTLPSILLNSHMVVVPVFEKSWIHPPFEAQLEDGVIYGRGVQDMKSVAIQYIEAIRRLKANGTRLKRTVHLSFVPDEEIGGLTGMAEFVKTQDFKNLNVGFSLDEGIASPNEDFVVFNGERAIYHVEIICAGKSGHGSLLLPDNCGEKLRYIIDKFMDFRKESKQKLADDPGLTIGDVTSVNLTMLSGGIQSNVVPEKLSATFDVRLALSFKPEQFEQMINTWCSEAGPGVTIEYIQRDPYVPPTVLDDSNQYWRAFKTAADKLNITLCPRTFPGGTDSRYLRARRLPALGFSPMARTAPALHQHEESLQAHVFLHGIRLYEQLIPAVANV